jgi:hypothetical protein
MYCRIMVYEKPTAILAWLLGGEAFRELLVNYRPEYQHGWGSKTYYTQLRLDPLPAVGADELLQALLGDAASLKPLTQLLIVRTEGNPFFLDCVLDTFFRLGWFGPHNTIHFGEVH